jgi:hypothetical protein
MAWFQKHPRRRRISADLSRPVPLKNHAPVTPPGKRLGRLIISLFFLAAGIAILNYPSSGPRMKVGDVAQRDYRARVDFQVPDAEATQRALKEKERSTLRVFVEDPEEIKRLPDDLKKLLESVTMARRVNDLAATSHRSRWGIGAEKLRVLKNELDLNWINELIPAVQTAAERAATVGIMNGTERQAELMSERYEILVRPEQGEGEPVRRYVAVTHEYPSALRDFFAQELQGPLSKKSPEFQQVLLDVLTHATKPTLRLDSNASAQAVETALNEVSQRYRDIARGSILLSAGEPVTPDALREILEERKTYAEESRHEASTPREPMALLREVWGGLGITGIFLFGFLLVTICVRHTPVDAFSSNTRLFGFYVAFLLVLAVARILERFGLSLHWTPVVLAAMFFTVTMGAAPALGASALLSVLVALVSSSGMPLALSLFLGATVAALMLLRVRRRTHVMEAGFLAGIVQFGVIWAMWTVQTANAPLLTLSPRLPLKESFAALGGGVLAGFVFTAILPYVERLFDIATDLRLLEWTDQNQPLLRKLALEAPGTYHHSTVVSNMAEAAAEEIGHNGLLARAGGYLHDVGKLTRPEYYVENTNGQPNPHEHISPYLSALILTAHTKDGEEVAAEYGVPAPLRRIVVEHHGTTMVEFFYNKAVEEAKDDGGSVKPEDFRYRGPKPQSPEAGIVMLADSAESAARSLDHVSPARIERLVHDIVEKRLKDGQLDDCRMDITEIRLVERSLVRSLTAISHPRISYPSE